MPARVRRLALASLLTVGLGAGLACAAPDRPFVLAGGLAPEVAELLRPDSARAYSVAEGVSYRYLWSPVGPWAVHLVEADLGRCRLGLDVATARQRLDPSQGDRERVTAMALRADGRALAAVNGDFFTPEGEPLGPEASSIGARRGAERPALAFRPGSGGPWIGVRPESDPSAPDWVAAGVQGADTATRIVAGFPELLAEGARVGDLGVARRASFAAARHPRTAVAWDPGRRRLWLVVVDGRQPGYSAGMSLPELAELLEALGAREALNLDGGGSSVLVVRGRTMSRPSDASGERPVPNALLLVDDPAQCPAGIPPGVSASPRAPRPSPP